jgi:hypothetical protein
MSEVAPRVLFLGENWWGSCARACSAALRRLGCDVLDVDQQTVFPAWRRRPSRAALRLMRTQLLREYNDRVMEAAGALEPELLLAFKGANVVPATLAALRARGVALYNYFPDRMALYEAQMAPTLELYDCVFDTKRYWDGDVGARLKPRALVHVPHGYDPDIHRPWPLEERDLRRFGCDVSFVGSYHVTKEALLGRLLELRPGLDLRIWGNRWGECRIPSLRARVQGAAVNGAGYARALRAARINLGLMGVTPEAKDETSTRTYEIPASGGFMLHERTPELLELFREGEEVACFDSVEELAEKIDHYLAHPGERERIAAAGHARCVPAYAYDGRMAQILRWHAEHRGGAAAARATAAVEA